MFTPMMTTSAAHFPAVDVNVWSELCVSRDVEKVKSVQIEGLASGDATLDLHVVYDAEFASLVRLAQLLVGERGLAEELVQDVFARLVERPPRLLAAEKLPAYVRSAVLNASRSRLRRKALERKQAQADRGDLRQPASQPLPDMALRQELLELPIRQRQCVALRYYEDCTVDDIASLLDISAGSVKTHLHRGLARLRELLGDDT